MHANDTGGNRRWGRKNYTLRHRPCSPHAANAAGGIHTSSGVPPIELQIRPIGYFRRSYRFLPKNQHAAENPSPPCIGLSVFGSRSQTKDHRLGTVQRAAYPSSPNSETNHFVAEKYGTANQKII